MIVLFHAEGVAERSLAGDAVDDAAGHGEGPEHGGAERGLDEEALP